MSGRGCASLRWLWLVGVAASGLVQANECSTTVGYRVLEVVGRPVAVWYPTQARATTFGYSRQFSGVVAHDATVSTACGGPVPLVVFSHGYTGCGLQSVTLTEELARHGYVVAAPDHADALLCHTNSAAARAPAPEQPAIFKPEAWTETSRRDRGQDIEAVIDALLTHRDFHGVIDADRIGLMGHSLGGYTVVGLAGGWPSWRDARIRAVVALSPYVMPFQTRHTLSEVTVPLMYQGGTADIGITPFLLGDKGAYAQAHSPAYLLELRGAGHFAWVNCGPERTTVDCFEHTRNVRLGTEYAIAFFDHHLKALPQPLLEQADPALARYEHK